MTLDCWCSVSSSVCQAGEARGQKCNLQEGRNFCLYGLLLIQLNININIYIHTHICIYTYIHVCGGVCVFNDLEINLAAFGSRKGGQPVESGIFSLNS